tara:strand:+ start:306 stop:968 length:663 start_codon:yes stop_codon:yes gene_type:complete
MKKKVKLSNNKLVAIIVVAILLSAGGSWLTLNTVTGRSAGDTAGYGNLTVSSLTAIQILPGYRYIDFGSGNVDAFAAIGHLYSANATMALGAGCQDCNWTLATGTNNKQNIQITNAGNTYINVTVLTNQTAADFLGGTGPVMEYNVTEHNATACTAALGTIYNGGFIPLRSNSNRTNVCNKLCPINNDTLNISLHFGVPGDASAGVRDLNITFYAEVSSL